MCYSLYRIFVDCLRLPLSAEKPEIHLTKLHVSYYSDKTHVDNIPLACNTLEVVFNYNWLSNI